MASSQDTQSAKIIQQYNDEIRNAVLAIGDFDKYVALKHKFCSRWALVLAQENAEDSWRILNFDDRGYLRHLDYSSKEIAITTAVRENYIFRDDEIADPLKTLAMEVA